MSLAFYARMRFDTDQRMDIIRNSQSLMMLQIPSSDLPQATTKVIERRSSTPVDDDPGRALYGARPSLWPQTGKGGRKPVPPPAA